MLVFIDESGDSGLKLDSGSSKYFTITLLVFEEHDEANACDSRIQLLKRELGYESNFEFHFKSNSDKVRNKFIEAVMPYSFFYYGICINKEKLYGDGFKNKESFYKYVCGLVFENAKDKLHEAIVIFDRIGGYTFHSQFSKYLKNKVNKNSNVIKSIKMQDSHKNNLLQLVDYVASIVNRSITSSKHDAQDYRKLISRREINVQIWPKF